MYRRPSSSLIAVELSSATRALVEAPAASLGDAEHMEHVGLERAQAAGARQLQALGREGGRLVERRGALDQAHRERERDRVHGARRASRGRPGERALERDAPSAARPSYMRDSPTSRQASAIASSSPAASSSSIARSASATTSAAGRLGLDDEPDVRAAEPCAALDAPVAERVAASSASLVDLARPSVIRGALERLPDQQQQLRAMRVTSGKQVSAPARTARGPLRLPARGSRGGRPSSRAAARPRQRARAIVLGRQLVR